MKALNCKLYVLFLIIAFTFLKAQNNSFIYELNYKPNSDSLKTEKILFYLDIKGNESTFRSDKFRQSDSLRALSYEYHEPSTIKNLFIELKEISILNTIQLQ